MKTKNIRCGQRWAVAALAAVLLAASPGCRARPRYTHAVKVTEGNFQTEVLDYYGLVAVDFWASWCGPCRRMLPTLAKVAERSQGQVKVGLANVDENPRLAETYRVQSIPNIVLFRNGKVVDSKVGVHSSEELLAWFDGYR